MKSCILCFLAFALSACGTLVYTPISDHPKPIEESKKYCETEAVKFNAFERLGYIKKCMADRGYQALVVAQ